MKTLLIILAVIFLVLALISIVVSVFYAISIFKQRAQQKEEFDKSWNQTKERIERCNQRPRRKPLATSSISEHSSGLSNQYLYDPMIAVAIASSDAGSSSYSGGSYSGCSGSSSSGSCSSSSSSSSSCD